MDKNFGCRVMDRVCEDMAYCVFVMIVIMVAVMMWLLIAVVMMIAGSFFMVMVRHKAVNQR